MSPNPKDIIQRDILFVGIALATGLILLIPLTAMQFTREVNWDKLDFFVMGSLLFVAGSTFVLVSRKVPRKYRSTVGALVAATLLYVWAELAVGLFTHLGS